jgi:hypothetical protein
MSQTGKRTLLVLFVCLLLNSPLVAQVMSSFHFGFIGSTGDTSVKLSEPVIIQYSKCFEITNGVPKFISPKFGPFAIACNEAPPKIELQVYAYPNPAVNQLTIRSLVNFPEKGQAKYSIIVTDLMGNPVRQVRTNISSLNQGVTIPVVELPLGYFIVTVYADKEKIQSFKILKAV